MWHLGFPPDPNDNDDDNRAHIMLGRIAAIAFVGYCLLGIFIFW